MVIDLDKELEESNRTLQELELGLRDKSKTSKNIENKQQAKKEPIPTNIANSNTNKV